MKSIQWKLVSMFALLVLATMMVFGTFVQAQISVFYHNNFKTEMELAFSQELVQQLEQAGAGEQPVERLKSLLDTYAGRIGINTNRYYCILDKKNGTFLAGSEYYMGVERTDNIISAMAGRVGDEVPPQLDYLDYALPVGNYIVYVHDSKAELMELLRTILGIVANAVLVGIVISVVIGFVMSKTITRPIVHLTKNAEALARGRFDTQIEVKSEDEIGKLTKTFNYMSAMIKDSTEEIAQEKNKLETIFRYMADGVMAFDINQHIIHINPAAKKMLGVTDERGIAFDRYFAQFHLDLRMAQLIYMNPDKTLERDFDVGDRHVKAYFATFKIDTDTLSGVVVVLQDMTEMQQLELSRREFVANVSHELRTPLTTIKTYSETLHESVRDEDERRFLDVIVHEVDRMTRIVRELLTLSSLDHNKLSMMKTEFALEALVEGVTSRMSMDAKKNRQELTFKALTVIPPVYGDVDRMEQVITNVISNALKYTPQGGKIEVCCGCLYKEAFIKIKDNGIGIPQDALPRIFDRFYRVDKARSREHGGTGLGLSIAREIVRLHGGTITITSQAGEGTEVTIKLPTIETTQLI